MKYNNLGEILRIRAEEDNANLIFIRENEKDKQVSYRQLLAKAKQYLGVLQSRGVEKNNKVVLCLNDNETFLYAFWGCILGGIIPVPIHLGENELVKDRISRIFHAIDNLYIITENQLKDKIQQSIPLDNKFIFCTNELEQNNLEGTIQELEPEQIALIQFSSGSTSEPKGVVLTHKNILINSKDICKRANIVPSELPISWMPLTHDMGLIGFHLTPLIRGNSQILMQASMFIKNPLSYLKKVEEYHANLLSSPNFGFELIEKALAVKPKADFDLSSVRLIFNGAEPIYYKLCMDFQKQLQKYGLKEHVIFPVYGMAEATLAITFPFPGKKINVICTKRDGLVYGERVNIAKRRSQNTVSLVSVGHAIDKCNIKLLYNKQEVKEGVIGEICIKGSNVTQGYYKNNKIIKASSSNGWLKTGDLGFLYNNELYITGRIKDLIIINGQNFYSQDIENIVMDMEIEDIKECAVCSVKNEHEQDDIIIFIASEKCIDHMLETVQEIKKNVSNAIKNEIKQVIIVKKIPKTTSGKKQRFKLIENYLAGKFNDIISEVQYANNRSNRADSDMTLSEEEKKLYRIFETVLEKQNIGLEDTIFEVGGNSLSAIKIMNVINDEFNRNFTVEELFHNFSIKGVSKLLETKEKSGNLLVINKSDDRDYFEVLPSHKKLYMLNELDNTNKLFHIINLFEIEGELDTEKLNKVMNELFQRHEGLRANFCVTDSKVKMFIRKESNVVFENLSINHKYSMDTMKEAVSQWNSMFDLGKDTLFRILFVKFLDKNILIFGIHHIIVDGTSLSIIMHDLMDLYHGIEVKKPQFHIKDYLVFRENFIKTEEFLKQKNYWINRFSDYVPINEIPTDYKRPEILNYDGNSLYHKLDKETTKKIREFAYKNHITDYVVLFAAFNILLHKYTRQEDFVVGTPVAGRSVKNSESIVGMLINTLPIRTYVNREYSTLEYIKQFNKNILSDLSNQAFYNEELAEALKLKTMKNRNGMFDVTFNFKNMEIPKLVLNNTILNPLTYEIEHSKVDIGFEIMTYPNYYDFEIEYSKELYEEDTINHLIKYYLEVLDFIINEPDTAIKNIHFKTNDISRKQVKSVELKVFKERFETQVELTPENVAVSFGDDFLTYSELNGISNKIAHYLLNCESNNKVAALLLNRSLERTSAMIACLKIGWAYLPIDVFNPADRIHFILQDSDSEILITDSEVIKQNDYKGKIIQLSNICQYPLPDCNPSINVAGSDLAYIIYTSGTTGKPKGVLADNSNLAGYIEAFLEEYKLKETDKFLHQASYSFDASVEEIYPILTVGGSVAVCSDDEIKDIDLLTHKIKKEEMTIISASPLLLNEINKKITNSTIHTYISGGDVLLWEHIDNLINNANVYNTYGPTETTVCVTYHKVSFLDKGKVIPIGKPIKGYTVYIMDDEGRQCPEGMIGELYVGGIGVARGYLNRKTLTAEKYVKNRYVPEDKLYKTGDLVKLKIDGTIEYIGRVDHQVKIRGYRIELNEIEGAIKDLDAVKDAVVIDKEKNGDKILAAFIIAEKELDLAYIRSELCKKIPAYMLPTSFLQLEKFPLTNNGKLNVSELRNQKMYSVVSRNHISPRNAIEETLVKIWKEILNIKTIGVQDNFFELGGHSLKMTTLNASIAKEFGVNLGIKKLFEKQTIEELAKSITYIQDTEDNHIIPLAESEYYEVSSAQKRMFILQKLDTDSIGYNITSSLKIKGKIDVNKVEKIFIQLIKRHESLRTSFLEKDSTIVQIIQKDIHFKIKYLNDVSDIDKAINDFVQPFVLEQAPLLRCALLKTGENEHILILDMHHIITDGVSIGIIVEEFTKLYQGEVLQELDIQYKDYALWHNRYLLSEEITTQKQYWINKLGDDLPILNMPTDYTRPVIQSFEGKTLRYRIGGELFHKIKEKVRQSDTTLYMFMLAGLNVLLCKYTGQTDIIVGTPIAGRNQVQTQNIVGMFVNTIVMRNQIEKDKSFREHLLKVKENCLEAYQNQDYPFECLVDDLNLQRDMSRNPIFDILFTMENLDNQIATVENLTIERMYHEYDIAKFDLSFTVEEFNDSIMIELEYCTKLFMKYFAEQMLKHYINILEHVTESLDKNILEFDVLSNDERELILYKLNQTDVKHPKDITFIEMFEQNVVKQPDKTAVVFEDSSLTYSQLNAKANEMAFRLKSLGVGRNDKIAIMINRSLEMLIGILGIIKSGAAYVPVDSKYPIERITYMFDDCMAKYIVTTKELADSISENYHKIILENAATIKGVIDNPMLINEPDDLMYIIYTSGTTGKPKGVMVMHKNVVSVAYAWINNYRLNTFHVRLLQLASMSFDVFVGDMCRGFLSGGTIYICKDEVKTDFQALYQLIYSAKINILESTPGLICAFLDYVYENALDISYMEILIVGSDACTILDYKKMLTRFSADMRIINSYGVTEATIDSGYYEVSEEKLPSCVNTPIGKPLDNVRYYILNKDFKPQPIGVNGELYIGGEGITKGYINNTKLTKEKFIDNPFIKGEQLYKTGDMARWLYDYNVEFLGRSDEQVKIRGYRIEIKEIEKKLLLHADVKEAVVVDMEDNNHQKFLCAFIVGRTEINIEHIRQYLRDNLPVFMIPAIFVEIDRIPMTSNGKVNLQKLRKYDIQWNSHQDLIKPETETQQILLDIWKRELGFENIGITDNFFEIGGQSIKAATISSKIYKEFGCSISLKNIFMMPTVKEQAEYIEQQQSVSYEQISCVEWQDYYEASLPQKRMYILQNMDLTNTGYNMSAAFLVTDKLDIKQFETSVNELFKRHEGLRTYFSVENGIIVQKIHDTMKFKLEVFTHQNRKLEEVMDEFIQPFNLEQAPLVRIVLADISGMLYILFDIHHIICDGVSVDILMKDLIRLYQGKVLEPLEIQYKDFAIWKNAKAFSDNLQKQKQFWKNEFLGEIPVLNLYTDYKRPKEQNFEGDSLNFELSNNIYKKLKELEIKNSTTSYIILLSGIYILLHKYTNQEDIVVGSIVAGRNRPEIENVIGVFINTLAIRSTLERKESYHSFLTRFNEHILDIYDNQEYQFEELLNDLNIVRDTSRNALFDVMFSMEDEITNYEPLQYAEYNRTKINFDLRFIVYSGGNKLRFKIEYAKKLFCKATIKSMAEHYINIINQICVNEDRIIDEINILGEKEKNKILYEFNNTVCNFASNKTFIELFEEQVEKSYHQTAVIFDKKNMTYGEFNQRVNQIARYLRRQGVTRDCIVAIMIPRSLDMLLSVFAVIKAGGAYLPIACDTALKRLQYILENSNAKVVITSEEYKMQLKGMHENIISIHSKDITDESCHNLCIINNPNDLMYVIYTSGSTGLPKGVMIEHKALINRINWMQKAYPIYEEDIILQKTTYTFDVSVWELVWWSLVGAKVCLLGDSQEKDVSAIINSIKENEITTIHFVPSMLNLFLDYVILYHKQKDVKSLRRIFTSGEALQVNQVKRFKEFIYPITSTDLINLYGPTEAAIDVTFFDCITTEFSNSVPIGKPIDNIKIYIVDSNLKLLPVGLPGELCIAGVGLARGYLNNEALTDEKFVDNPFEPGAKMYRTGDLVRWLKDGNIEYIGRMDFQVKLRGFRIELGEIEQAIMSIDEMKETVVVVKKAESGDQVLCAYYVADCEISKEVIIKKLSLMLPDYMMPMYYQQLENMPITANGKLDRKVLPYERDNQERLTKYVEASTDIERSLVRIWKSVLDVKKIGINDNFFDLGGHSLKITHILADIFKELKVEIPFQIMFKTPTIKEIAQYISTSSRQNRPAIEKAPYKEYYELSNTQRRMYLLQQFDLAAAHYNMPEVILVTGELNIQKVSTAFQELVNRHESLRTSFVMKDGEIYQKIAQSIDLLVEYEDINERTLDNIIDTFIQPFDLSTAPLMRVKIVKIKSTEYAILFDMHHIISDGMSKGIIVTEFTKLYDGQVLEELEFQYKDYSEWTNKRAVQESIKKQKEYWLDKLKDDLPVLNLHTDFNRPVVQNFKGEVLIFDLDSKLTNNIKKLCEKFNCTSYMVYLSFINILLSKYSGQEDILIGTPVIGRKQKEFHSIVGMFVNTVVMRNYPNSSEVYEDFLKEIIQNTIEAYDNQDYQFENLVDDIKVERSLSRNPVFDVMFTMLEDEISEYRLDNLVLRGYGDKGKYVKFDLNFSILEYEDKSKLSIQYAKVLFKKETILKMYEHFIEIVNAVIQNTKIKLLDIDMLSKREKAELIQFIAPYKADLSDKTVIEQFQNIVKQYPNKIAVTYNNKGITYDKLNKKANQLARILRKNDIKPNDIVGFIFDKSIEMIIAILAILKSGGAYLPLDPGSINERTYHQLEECRVCVVLMKDSSLLVESTKYKKICFDSYTEISEEDNNLTIVNTPKDLVYIIYTSGSTGKPKGVMIKHSNLMSLYVSLNQLVYENFTENINIALLAPIVFDASVKQIFGSLLNGHNLIMIDEKDKLNEKALLDFYLSNKINVSDGTPFLLELLNNCQKENKTLTIDYFLIGGDVLRPGTVNMFRNNYGNDIKIVNIYGPTECCVDSTAYIIDSDTEIQDSIPIGKPLSNISIYILDQNLIMLPVGQYGEVYIEGPNVGQGYLGDRSKTKERFIHCPYKKGHIMYKTGDIAKWLPDGNIEFSGRDDGQVKIRGYRIELSEIEQAILQEKEIKEAVVLEKGDLEHYLCAYITLKEESVTNEIAATISPNVKNIKNQNVSGSQRLDYNLRNRLKNRLPEYMIPSFIIELEKFPITQNGKIDYKQLRTMENHLSQLTDSDTPQNDIERQLLYLWKTSLGLKQLGINDNFFEIGGNSIIAMRLVAKLKEEYYVGITDIFMNQTIKNLAKTLEMKKKNAVTETTEKDDSIEKWEEISSTELESIINEVKLNMDSYEKLMYSFPINRLYNLLPVQKYTLQSKINIQFITNFDSQMDPVILEKAVGDVIKTYSLLHSSMDTIDEQMMWKEYLLIDEIKIPSIDVSHYHTEISNKIIDKLLKVLNIMEMNELKYKVLLIIKADGEISILWTMHHSIFDGTSKEIINNLCILYYNKYISGGSNKRISCKDYYEYVMDIEQEAENIDYDKIIKLFELDKYRKLSVQATQIMRDNNILSLGVVSIFSFSIAEGINLYDEGILDASLSMFKAFAQRILSISNIPFYTYYFGRKKGETYYDSIGEYIDVMPVIFEEYDSLASKELINERIRLAEKEKICFSYFILNESANIIKDFIHNDNKSNSIYFNFLGYRTNEEQELLCNNYKEYMLSFVQDKDTKDISFQCMFSESKVTVIIDGLNKIFYDQAKSIMGDELFRTLYK